MGGVVTVGDRVGRDVEVSIGEAGSIDACTEELLSFSPNIYYIVILYIIYTMTYFVEIPLDLHYS